MPKRYSFLLLVIITVLAAYLRLNQFLISPPGFHIDESDIAYQAYSILKTGRDYHRNFLPIHPQSFTDRRPFLYMYALIPFISIFGLNELGARLPSAVFGILTVPAVFWLGKNIFEGKTQAKNLYGYLVAFILAILPWHIHYSRVGFELTFMLLLLIVGLTFFIRWLHNQKYSNLIYGIVFLILTIYVYSTAKLFVPLIITVFVILSKDTLAKLSKKQVILILSIATILLLPLINDTLAGVGRERFSILSVFSDKNAISQYLHYQWLSSYSTPYLPFIFIHPNTLSKIFLSEPIHLFYSIANAYLSPFSLQFLIFSGDPNPRHVIPTSGVAGLAVTFLFVFGFVKLINQKNTEFKYFILTLLILAPLPSSITREGQYHATRMFFLILPLTLMAALGAKYFLDKPRRLANTIIILLLAFTLVWEISRDQFIRLAVYPISGYNVYNWGWKEIVKKIDYHSDKFSEVIIDNSEGAPIQTLYAFFQKIDPLIFQAYSNKSNQQYSDDNIKFRPINPIRISSDYEKNTLIIIDKDALSKNALSIDKLNNVEIKDVIKSPVGEDIIYLLVVKRKKPS